MNMGKVMFRITTIDLEAVISKHQDFGLSGFALARSDYGEFHFYEKGGQVDFFPLLSCSRRQEWQTIQILCLSACDQKPWQFSRTTFAYPWRSGLCVMAGLEFVGLLPMARAAGLRRDHHRYAVAEMVEGVRPRLVCLMALVAADADLRVAADSPLLHSQRRCSVLVAGNARLALLGRSAGKLGDVRCCRGLAENGSYRERNSTE
jgi:hypothetical protein